MDREGFILPVYVVEKPKVKVPPTALPPESSALIVAPPSSLIPAEQAAAKPATSAKPKERVLSVKDNELKNEVKEEIRRIVTHMVETGENPYPRDVELMAEKFDPEKFATYIPGADFPRAKLGTEGAKAAEIVLETGCASVDYKRGVSQENGEFFTADPIEESARELASELRVQKHAVKTRVRNEVVTEFKDAKKRIRGNEELRAEVKRRLSADTQARQITSKEALYKQMAKVRRDERIRGQRNWLLENDPNLNIPSPGTASSSKETLVQTHKLLREVESEIRQLERRMETTIIAEIKEQNTTRPRGEKIKIRGNPDIATEMYKRMSKNTHVRELANRGVSLLQLQQQIRAERRQIQKEKTAAQFRATRMAQHQDAILEQLDLRNGYHYPTALEMEQVRDKQRILDEELTFERLVRQALAQRLVDSSQKLTGAAKAEYRYSVDTHDGKIMFAERRIEAQLDKLAKAATRRFRESGDVSLAILNRGSLNKSELLRLRVQASIVQRRVSEETKAQALERSRAATAAQVTLELASGRRRESILARLRKFVRNARRDPRTIKDSLSNLARNRKIQLAAISGLNLIGLGVAPQGAVQQREVMVASVPSSYWIQKKLGDLRSQSANLGSTGMGQGGEVNKTLDRIIQPATQEPVVPPAIATTEGIIEGGQTEKIPVYEPRDFLQGYFENKTYSVLTGSRQWINTTTDTQQYKTGGVSFWDFFSKESPFGVERIQWQDDKGEWHAYTKERIKDKTGKEVESYVLAQRNGPGVINTLLFAQDAVEKFKNQVFGFEVNLLQPKPPPELEEWGNIHKLGNLRLEIDGKIAYDGSIKDWFTGKPLGLSPELAKALFWKYKDYGSTGSILPIPYQNNVKVSVYGGEEQPKWFTISGVSLPAGTLVKPFDGTQASIEQDNLLPGIANVSNPENYIDRVGKRENLTLEVGKPGQKSAEINLKGEGTVTALQFRVPKNYDAKSLWLKVKYGNELGIDMPFLALFSDSNQVSVHNSTPMGVIDDGKNYLFYCNFPLPYQNDLTVELATQGQPVSIPVAYSTVNETLNTQFRAKYDKGTKLQNRGPDYNVKIDGNGKMVGFILQTGDQDYRSIADEREVGTGQVWPMGYLESDITVKDGQSNMIVWNGLEDATLAGMYWNVGYNVPEGGSNRPFAGILRYKQSEDGYATIFRYFNDTSAFEFQNGLNIAIQHGTKNNNFPVTYGSTVLYYSQVSEKGPKLPASGSIVVKTSSNAPNIMRRPAVPPTADLKTTAYSPDIAKVPTTAESAAAAGAVSPATVERAAASSSVVMRTLPAVPSFATKAPVAPYGPEGRLWMNPNAMVIPNLERSDVIGIGDLNQIGMMEPIIHDTNTKVIRISTSGMSLDYIKANWSSTVEKVKTANAKGLEPRLVLVDYNLPTLAEFQNFLDMEFVNLPTESLPKAITFGNELGIRNTDGTPKYFNISHEQITDAEKGMPAYIAKLYEAVKKVRARTGKNIEFTIPSLGWNYWQASPDNVEKYIAAVQKAGVDIHDPYVTFDIHTYAAIDTPFPYDENGPQRVVDYRNTLIEKFGVKDPKMTIGELWFGSDYTQDQVWRIVKYFRDDLGVWNVILLPHAGSF